MTNPLRVLSRIEQAFTIVNEAFPMTAVGVIKMEAGPSPATLRKALDKLQEEHPSLRVSIRRKGGSYYFFPLSAERPIPLDCVARQDDQQWIEEATTLLNTAIDPGAGPLLRCRYLVSDALSGRAELIIAYHHAIGDAISTVHFLDQLLRLSAEEEGATPEKKTPPSVEPYELLPGAEALFPRKFRGLALAGQLAKFVMRELGHEIAFRRRIAGSDLPAIPSSPVNGILTLTITPERSRQLIAKCRRHGVSLVAALSTAMLLAVRECRHQGSVGASRVIVFADMRPYLKPPVAVSRLGCYISMLRFTRILSGEMTFWDLAGSLSRQIYQAGKRGERFLAAFLSKTLVKMTLRRADQRLGTVALSYIGPLDLQPAYGAIRIRGIHGFVTSNPLGAELAAFGRIFNDQIELDLQFLTGELDPSEAEEVARKINELLMGAL